MRNLLKVLIVEDEDFERTAIKFLLNEYFSESLKIVGEAFNGKDALDMTLEYKPDLILMDISMPIMDGLEASKRIREYNRDIEIIILTAYGEFDYAKTALKSGVIDYLVKPYSNDEFRKSICKAVCKIKKRFEDYYNLPRKDRDLNLESLMNEDNKNNLNIVIEAKKFIDENYMKDIRLDDVADHVNISSFYFSRIFKKYEGKNYIQYLTKIRMEKAKEMIINNEVSIKEVAMEVGYSDQNYFSKAFKKYTKLSPSEFARQYNLQS